MSTAPDAFSRLLEVLDRLEIPYEVGGSVASSSHGIPRTTLNTAARNSHDGAFARSAWMASTPSNAP